MDLQDSSGGAEVPGLDIIAIRTALSQSLAAPITDDDPLPAQLAYTARRMHGRYLTTNVLVWWIADQAAAKRNRRDPIQSPGYWRHLVNEGLGELRRWLITNREQIQRLIVHDIEAERAARLAGMPPARFRPTRPMPPKVKCPTCLAMEAIPHGDMLICVSARCDPRGVLWADLLRHYTEPIPPRKAAKNA